MWRLFLRNYETARARGHRPRDAAVTMLNLLSEHPSLDLIVAGLRDGWLQHDGKAIDPKQPTLVDLSDFTRLWLTDLGHRRVADLLKDLRIDPPQPGSSRPPCPVYDIDSCTLMYEGVVIRKFKRPAPNQEEVLASFEEARWPTRITSPIRGTTPQCNDDPRVRFLHSRRQTESAVWNLNRRLAVDTIRFIVRNRGEQIAWETIGRKND